MINYEFKINEGVLDFNPFEVLKDVGWAGDPCTITVTNNVDVGASNTSRSAFDATGLSQDCMLTIINKGRIIGCGGQGGCVPCHGTSLSKNIFGYKGRPGQTGGTALELSCPTVINNDAGLIAGGGGGGAAGSGQYVNQVGTNANGGSGGAGFAAGCPGSCVEIITRGIDGAPGGITAGGVAVGIDGNITQGGYGGDLGMAGQSKDDDDRIQGPVPTGGAAGFAIKGQKFITSISGNRETTIKGPLI